jgi:hypothetical protein
MEGRKESMSLGQIFTAQYPCEQSRINILQWILTKLGTYLGESGTLLMFKVKGQGHEVCTKFGQNPLKDVDSRVFTRMFHGKKNYPVTLTFDLENQ